MMIFQELGEVVDADGARLVAEVFLDAPLRVLVSVSAPGHVAQRSVDLCREDLVDLRRLIDRSINYVDGHDPARNRAEGYL